MLPVAAARVRARLPRRSRSASPRTGEVVARGAARRRAARPGRAVHAQSRSRRDPARRHSISRRSACSARSSTRHRRSRPPTTRRPSSSRSATSRPRCSSPAAGRASSPASSTGAEARSRTRSRTSSRCRAGRGGDDSHATSRSRARAGTTTSLDEATRAKALDAVRPRLTPFARELVSSLQFYQTQAESLGIGGIVDHRRHVASRGLADALHQMIGVNVCGRRSARAGRSAPVDISIRRSRRRSARSPCRSGSRSRTSSMRGVNLLPKEARQTKKPALEADRDRRASSPSPCRSPRSAFLFMRRARQGQRPAESSSTPCRAEIAALPEPTTAGDRHRRRGDEASRATAVAQTSSAAGSRGSASSATCRGCSRRRTSG